MEEDLSRQFRQLGTEDSLSHIDLQTDEGNQSFGEDASENCNLIVNYLPHDIDDSSLRDMFASFGEIVMTKVVRDKNTKKSLGYGFVKFLKEDDAVFAIDKMNGFSIGHKNLKVSVARPPSLEIRNCKLYVTNLPKDYTEREVVQLFKEFGDIIECRVLKDRNARSNKGVAFVQFNLKSQANNALSLNGCQLEGSSRGLVVKYAEDQHKKKELSRLQSLTASSSGSNHMEMGHHSMVNGHGGPNGHVFNRAPPMMMGGGGGGLGGMGGMNHHQHHHPHMGGGGGMMMMNDPPGGHMSGMPHGGGGVGGGMMQQGGGGLPGLGGMGGGGGAGQGGMGGGLNNPKGLRIDAKHPEMAQYYYQQQQGIPTLYGGLGSPMMSPLNSPQLSIYVPPPGGAPSMLDYSPSHKRPLKGRKGFHLESVDQQQQQQQQQQQSNWYNSMPQHMSFMASPMMGPPQHSPMNLAIQQTMAMISSPQNSTHHPLSPRADGSPPSPPYSGSVTLNVANLPAHADVAMLHDLFSPYGRILSAQIDFDTSPQSRGGVPQRVSVCSGRGRVQMAGMHQGEIAAHGLNGAIVCEGGMPIQVTLSFR